MTEKPEMPREVWVKRDTDDQCPVWWNVEINEYPFHDKYTRSELIPPQAVIEMCYEALEYVANRHGPLNVSVCIKALTALAPYITRQQENE